MTHTTFVSADDIRAMFTAAIAQMYRAEAPRYRAMEEIVAEIDQTTLSTDLTLEERLRHEGLFDLVGVARHGAIRIGTPQELSGLRRLFAVMGMWPVGYYDLAPAGVPVHSTCFRPTETEALRASPFRIFTSLLRPELIEDAALRRAAQEILARRRILTPRCERLIEICEAEGGLTEAQASEFVGEALATFRWRGEATVPKATYDEFRAAHPLIADVVCFHGPHINHLTQPTLDIDAAQRAMAERRLDPKSIVEGPPRRRAPILLRQTSYKAVSEPVRFADGAEGVHAARFGEIEQRGVALTAKGRALYDKLLTETNLTAPASAGVAAYEAELARRFAAFPDDSAILRAQGLAFFRYAATGDAVPAGVRRDRESLLSEGFLRAEPILYEDFLPVSAAGIFQSNLGDSGRRETASTGDRLAFEAALGASVADPFRLYERIERDSLASALEALGVDDEPS